MVWAVLCCARTPHDNRRGGARVISAGSKIRVALNLLKPQPVSLAPSPPSVQPLASPSKKPRRMAPSISEIPPGHDVQAAKYRGLTSGQHEPDFASIPPFSEFPEELTGPTVWAAEDYRNNPERWVRQWSDDEIAEIETATDAFLGAGYPLTKIKKVARHTSLWTEGVVVTSVYPGAIPTAEARGLSQGCQG